MFEFDEEKSRANLAKHGIDFHDAQGLWEDPHLIETQGRIADEQGGWWSPSFPAESGLR